MTNVPGQATITPERQTAALQVGSVFNSMQSYLQSLAHPSEDGKLILTEALNDARKKIQEASYWAIQHVLMNGLPPAPKPAADLSEPNTTVSELQPSLSTDNASGAANNADEPDRTMRNADGSPVESV